MIVFLPSCSLGRWWLGAERFRAVCGPLTTKWVVTLQSCLCLLGEIGCRWRLGFELLAGCGEICVIMESPIVMSVIGPDRPGLVELVASTVKAAGGNWLESRMCHLGGQFAGILRVSAGDGRRDELLSAVAELEAKGLSVVVKDAGDSVDGSCHEVATIEIVGNDRPGIVSHISNAFAKRGVNVEELSTGIRSAPMSGETLFEAKARVCIPEDCDVADLRRDLELIAADLMVDVSFESD
ncbi:ACT domain protein [Verrucomicrobiia bacterium DG1235]|nr:ACT domain protein [Verrucomicrobiae bacterium DG1235]